MIWPLDPPWALRRWFLRQELRALDAGLDGAGGAPTSLFHALSYLPGAAMVLTLLLLSGLGAPDSYLLGAALPGLPVTLYLFALFTGWGRETSEALAIRPFGLARDRVDPVAVFARRHRVRRTLGEVIDDA